MSGDHPSSSNPSYLRSATPIPYDNQRIRISGRLVSVCDTVFIPHLGYNGTITGIRGRIVTVQPHDYGPLIRDTPHNFQKGKVISTHQRRWLDRKGIAYHDDTILFQGTFPARRRGKDIKKKNITTFFTILTRFIIYYFTGRPSVFWSLGY